MLSSGSRVSVQEPQKRFRRCGFAAADVAVKCGFMEHAPVIRCMCDVAERHRTVTMAEAMIDHRKTRYPQDVHLTYVTELHNTYKIGPI